jgi:hypothetical protein
MLCNFTQARGEGSPRACILRPPSHIHLMEESLSCLRHQAVLNVCATHLQNPGHLTPTKCSTPVCAQTCSKFRKRESGSAASPRASVFLAFLSRRISQQYFFGLKHIEAGMATNTDASKSSAQALSEDLFRPHWSIRKLN